MRVFREGVPVPLVSLTQQHDSLKISQLVYGIWRWSESLNAEAIVRRCLDLGITTFDAADIYGDYTCEALLGKVLKEHPEWRQQMQIVTKCGIKLISTKRPNHYIKHYDTSYEHIIASTEQSLQNLSTNYIDLLLIHRPDFLMDANEIARAFTDLKASGKVHHFGVSNFTPSQFELIHSRFPLITNQIEFNALHLEPTVDGVLDQLQRLAVCPMAWSPLAGGKVLTGQDERSVRTRKVLEKLAEQHKASVDNVAYAFVLKHPASFAVILGTNSIERVEHAVEALNVNLSRQEWYEVWRASTGVEVP